VAKFNFCFTETSLNFLSHAKKVFAVVRYRSFVVTLKMTVSLFWPFLLFSEKLFLQKFWLKMAKKTQKICKNSQIHGQVDSEN